MPIKYIKLLLNDFILRKKDMKLHFIRFLIFFIVILAKIFASDLVSCEGQSDISSSEQSSLSQYLLSQETPCNCGTPFSNFSQGSDLPGASPDPYSPSNLSGRETTNSLYTSSPSNEATGSNRRVTAASGNPARSSGHEATVVNGTPARSSRHEATTADFCTPARALPSPIKGIEVDKITASTNEKENIQSFVTAVKKAFKERSGEEQGFDVVNPNALENIRSLNNLALTTQAQMPCVFAFLERDAQEASVLVTVKLLVPELQSQSSASSPLSGSASASSLLSVEKQKILAKTKNCKSELEIARSIFSPSAKDLTEIQYDPQQFFSAFVAGDTELFQSLEDRMYKKDWRLKEKILDKAKRTIKLEAESSECERKVAKLNNEIDKENEKRSSEKIRLKREYMQPYMHELDASLSIDQQFEKIRALVLPFSHTERQALSECLFSKDRGIVGTMFCYTRAKPCNHAEGSDNQGLPCVSIYSILGEVFENVEFRVFFKDETHNESFSVQQAEKIFGFIRNTDNAFLNLSLQGKLMQDGMPNIQSLLTNLLNPKLDQVRRAELSDILFKRFERDASTETRAGFYNSIYGTRNVKYIRI